jgi:lysophospholipase L1-like esterase
MTGQHWVASWATPLAQAHGDPLLPPTHFRSAAEVESGPPPHAPVSFALPGARAVDQTFRAILRPQLWRETVRLRFSNVFGDADIELAGVTIALHESSARLLPGSVVPVTFEGGRPIVIPAGASIESDPVRLPFVTSDALPWLRGRELAVSYAVSGEAARLTSSRAPVTSFISAPGSGDHAADEDERAFRYAVPAYFLLAGLDVLADSDSFAVVALGDLNTGGSGANDLHDAWPEILGRRLREILGDRVSVVNSAIAGNTVVTEWEQRPKPTVLRLHRDALGTPGVTTVIWMQGHNDLAWGGGADELIAGYKRVVEILHGEGLRVIGCTLTSVLWPGADYDASPLGPELARRHGSPEMDGERRRVNDYITTSGIFDAVTDMAAATDDPATGAMRTDTHAGDGVHATRAGHIDMANAVDPELLVLPKAE